MEKVKQKNKKVSNIMGGGRTCVGTVKPDG